MRFTKVPENLFNEMQPNAGVLLNDFNPDEPGAAASIVSAIIGATTGGLNFNAAASYKDGGEGIDNCPKNMMELKEIENWEITMSGTFVTVTAASAKSLVGAADVVEGKITPRDHLVPEDFADVWWVGDYSKKNGETKGGFMAIHMMNVLNTAGFQLQTSDKEKGQFAFTYTAHYSIEEQTVVPFEIYIQEGSDEA